MPWTETSVYDAQFCDMLCAVCTAVIDPDNEEYASGYVDKYGSYYMCEECKSWMHTIMARMFTVFLWQ